ncbi:hypothetical protein LSH36_188g10015 [Paralvinella palmiformis]|uniref:UDP-xylose and UDP-N-acetylglucosamine transporter n=1 Tax=Paralvinella palmiformis TaxID=53620 RepID=A0AAD9JS74_9ANNE|nr:hypothetical protein LSH36_188g10015 [Paralvinella palmiformis]
MHQAVPIALVFIGCGSNVVFLELLVKEIPSSGHIVTFFQFAFITIVGFIFTANFGRKKPVIPISTYGMMVTLYFLTSVVNNYALNFNISMPLHMIFRAGSLMANLILGVIILKRSYAWYKYLSVLMISIGIAIATIASSQQVGQAGQHVEGDMPSEERVAWEYVRWLIGIFLLTFALFMSARMGIYQEMVYRKHGKHPSEALFYNFHWKYLC